jgi:hypothetical protein
MTGKPTLGAELPGAGAALGGQHYGLSANACRDIASLLPALIATSACPFAFVASASACPYCLIGSI